MIMTTLLIIAVIIFVLHEAGVWLKNLNNEYGKGCQVIPAVFPRGVNLVPLPIGTIISSQHMANNYMVRWSDNKVTMHRRSSIHPADA